VTMPALTGVKLFTYRVGFGDCFLLRFEYDDRPRHVLVDFGSTAPASTAIGAQLEEIAKDIAVRCEGRLDAIVATHRHRDHVAGFAGKPWKVLSALGPKLVVLPWTEHPDAAVDAKVAPSGSALAIGAASTAHVRALADLHRVAAAALAELRQRAGDPEPLDDDDGPGEPRGDDDPANPWDAADLGPLPVSRPVGKELAAQLAFVGEDNLQNAEALKNLLSIPKRDFVAFGSRTRLEDVLPGVKVRVLGPPTLAQTEAIRRQRARDPDEFWHVMALAGEAATRRGGPGLFPGVRDVPATALPLETRWFLSRLDSIRAEELLQIVRALDEVLNNTSVILLFQLPGPRGKKLLFPGDAQLENWSYALGKAEVRKLLAGVDVLKVGHHGSLNATPKTLWNLLEKRGGPRKPGRLKTFMSTRKGKHGSTKRGTEVPRRPLVEALERDSTLVTTTDLKGKEGFVREDVIV